VLNNKKEKKEMDYMSQSFYSLQDPTEKKSKPKAPVPDDSDEEKSGLKTVFKAKDKVTKKIDLLRKGNVVDLHLPGKIPKPDGKLKSHYNGNEPFGEKWQNEIYKRMIAYHENALVKLVEMVAAHLGRSVDMLMDTSEGPSLIKRAEMERVVVHNQESGHRDRVNNAVINNEDGTEKGDEEDDDEDEKKKPETKANQGKVSIEEGREQLSGGEKRKRLPRSFNKNDLYLWILQSKNPNSTQLQIAENLYNKTSDLGYQWLQYPVIGGKLQLSNVFIRFLFFLSSQRSPSSNSHKKIGRWKNAFMTSRGLSGKEWMKTAWWLTLWSPFPL
jgi:hypothetical protein